LATIVVLVGCAGGMPRCSLVHHLGEGQTTDWAVAQRI